MRSVLPILLTGINAVWPFSCLQEDQKDMEKDMDQMNRFVFGPILILCAFAASCSNENRERKGAERALVEFGFEQLPAEDYHFREIGRRKSFEFVCDILQFSDWLTGSRIYYQVSGHYRDDKIKLQKEVNRALKERGHGIFLHGDFVHGAKTMHVSVDATSDVSGEKCSVNVEIFVLSQ